MSHTHSARTLALDRFVIKGATDGQKDVFWTGVVHSLQVSSKCSFASPIANIARMIQYPSEQHKQGAYYSGYDGLAHRGEGVESYTGYSIWVHFTPAFAALTHLSEG